MIMRIKNQYPIYKAIYITAIGMAYKDEIEGCLIFEDSISGIKYAYAAGCKNIVVVDSANKKEEYEQLHGLKK